MPVLFSKIAKILWGICQSIANTLWHLLAKILQRVANMVLLDIFEQIYPRFAKNLSNICKTIAPLHTKEQLICNASKEYKIPTEN